MTLSNLFVSFPGFLPLSPEHDEWLEMNASRPQTSNQQAPTIAVLLVEDSSGDARLVQEMLSEATVAVFELTHAERLDEALDLVAKSSFDVVLLDLDLPDSQGPNTFLKLQAHATDVPVVVLSGLDDETIAVTAIRAGAQDYLIKGQIDSHLLSRALRYAIERHRLQAELELTRPPRDEAEERS